jgi:hypothetical protein
MIPASNHSPLRAYEGCVGNKAGLFPPGIWHKTGQRFLLAVSGNAGPVLFTAIRSFNQYATHIASSISWHCCFYSRSSDFHFCYPTHHPSSLLLSFASPTMSSSVPVDSFIIHGDGEREIVHLPRVLISICHLLNEIHSHLAGIWWLTLIMTLPGDVSAPGGSCMGVGLIDLLWEPANREPFSKDRNRHDALRPLRAVTGSTVTELTTCGCK